PQDRDHRRLLALGRVLGQPPVDLGLGVRREGEGCGLLLGAATDAQRSTAPNTMSMEPRMAETSASMWPRFSQSMACRCLNPGAAILQRYGRLVPSETR